MKILNKKPLLKAKEGDALKEAKLDEVISFGLTKRELDKIMKEHGVESSDSSDNDFEYDHAVSKSSCKIKSI